MALQFYHKPLSLELLHFCLGGKKTSWRSLIEIMLPEKCLMILRESKVPKGRDSKCCNASSTSLKCLNLPKKPAQNCAMRYL